MDKHKILGRLVAHTVIYTAGAWDVQQLNEFIELIMSCVSSGFALHKVGQWVEMSASKCVRKYRRKNDF